MATVTRLVTTPDSGNTPNTTGSFTPNEGDLLIVVAGLSASTSIWTEVPTASANGITFSGSSANVVTNGTNTLALHVANQLVGASPSAMTITWDPSDTATSTIIEVYAVRGGAGQASAAVVQYKTGAAAGGTTPSLTFTSAVKSSSVTLLTLSNLSAPAGVTEPSGWTELSDTSATSPTIGLEVAARESGFTGTAVTWGSTSATNWLGVGVEITTTSPVTATASSAWSVVNQITQTTPSAWDVTTVVSSTVSSAWSVSADTTPVTQTQTSSWNVSAVITATKNAAWFVHSISARTVGQAYAGTTTVNVAAWPSGHTTGDALFLIAAWKSETATAPDLGSDWMLVYENVVGAGTAGEDSGEVRHVAWRWLGAGTPGTVAVTPVGGSNTIVAGSFAFLSALGGWSATSIAYGEDTTQDTSFSVTSDGSLSVQPGDAFFISAALNTYVSPSSWTLTMSGVAFTSALDVTYIHRTQNGNNVTTVDLFTYVRTGTVTNTVTLAPGTLAVASAGGVAFIRLRAGTTQPVMNTVATRWNVEEEGVVTAFADSAWHVGGKVTGTKASSWNVAGGITSVTLSERDYGTTSATSTISSSTNNDDAVFLMSSWKPDTATAPSISGWTKLQDVVVGGGSAGEDTGPQRLVLYRKDTVTTGDRNANITVTPEGGGSNVIVTAIAIWRKDVNATWQVDTSYGDVPTAAAGTGQNFNPIAQSYLPYAQGRRAFGWGLGSRAVTPSSWNFSTPGVSFSANSTQYVENTTNGDNLSVALGWPSGTQGSGGVDGLISAVMSWSGGTTQTGGALFIVLTQHFGTTVTGSVSSAWDVEEGSTTPVTQTADSAWAIDAQVTQTEDSAWHVLETVTQTVNSAYHVVQTILQTADSAWLVSSQITATAESAWEVQASVEQTAASAWDVLSITEQTKPVAWHVLAAIEQTEDSAWNVDAEVTQSTASAWNVASALSAVTASTALAWDVLEVITQSADSAWVIDAQVSQTSDSAWDVLSGVEQVEDTAWSIFAPVAQTASSAWHVLSQTSQTTNTAWHVLEVVEQVEDAAWDVLEVVESTEDSAWVVRLDVTSTVDSAWSIVGSVTATADSAWNVDGAVLATPSGLTATAVSQTQINLSWNAVNGATGYDIERDSSVIVMSHATTTYPDTGLAVGSEHTYRVRAVKVV